MTRVRPTRRGALVLAGAALAYLVGWAFGTDELAVLALVLALSVVLAYVTVWSARRTPRRITRRLPPRTVAGVPFVVAVQIEPAPWLVSATLVERCAALGDPCALLEPTGGTLDGVWRVSDPPRGRYELLPELVLEDVLGLVRVRDLLPAPGRLRVEPELVELGSVRALELAQRDGARRAFASSAGDALAGVRDHEVGESLRRVHWRTTARRGRLTVRELEDHPRDDLHVLLDAAAQAGSHGLRSPIFERAVQAAGSLVLHAARRGIAVSFESHGARDHHVALERGTRAALLDALCSVEADGGRSLGAQLARPPAGRLCIVTSDLGPSAVERMLALRARRRGLAVVAIDAASWGGEAAPLAGPAGELARAGVEVVIVRHGDDLARRLAPLVDGGMPGAA